MGWETGASPLPPACPGSAAGSGGLEARGRKWGLSRALLTPCLCLDSLPFLFVPHGVWGQPAALNSQLLDGRTERTAGICGEPSDDGTGPSPPSVPTVCNRLCLSY